MANILVVDDAKFMRVTLSNILTKADHVVIGEAEDGQSAVDLFKKLKPDLITMDITMPGMNGLEAVKEIISFNPEAKIIMCSAMGHQKLVVEAIEMGAKDFLVKPFEEDRVLDSIKRILN